MQLEEEGNGGRKGSTSDRETCQNDDLIAIHLQYCNLPRACSNNERHIVRNLNTKVIYRSSYSTGQDRVNSTRAQCYDGTCVACPPPLARTAPTPSARLRIHGIMHGIPLFLFFFFFFTTSSTDRSSDEMYRRCTRPELHTSPALRPRCVYSH